MGGFVVIFMECDQPNPGTFTVTITATDTTDDRINISQTFFFKVEEDIRYSREDGKQSYVHELGFWYFNGVRLAINANRWVITKTIDSVKWKFTRAGYKETGNFDYFEIRRQRCPGGVCP